MFKRSPTETSPSMKETPAERKCCIHTMNSSSLGCLLIVSDLYIYLVTALVGPFLTLFSALGVETTPLSLYELHFWYCFQSGGAFTGWRTLTMIDHDSSLMSKCCEGYEPPENDSKRLLFFRA